LTDNLLRYFLLLKFDKYSPAIRKYLNELIHFNNLLTRMNLFRIVLFFLLSVGVFSYIKEDIPSDDIKEDIRFCDEKFQKYLAYRSYGRPYAEPKCTIFSKDPTHPEKVANYIAITFGMERYIYCIRFFDFGNTVAILLEAVDPWSNKKTCPPESEILRYPLK
jgi:hypothetical protein